MRIAVDMAYKSLNHFGEELCGDKVEIVRTEHSKIMILSDGMGSGVRANILATLTSKILSTLFQNELSIDDAVETIAKTLPISSVNGVAYSTFTILQVFDDGNAYLVDFDTPGCIYIHDGKLMKIPYAERMLEGKLIKEFRFQVEVGDTFVLMSDGAIYCGTGDVINYGWDWQNIADYALKCTKQTRSASGMADLLSSACYDLYGQKPSDDTTLAVARIQEEHILNILTGPPVDPADDARMVYEFVHQKGVHIVSGGVSGKIVARELGKEIKPSYAPLDPDIPPMSQIDGIELVTEGVVTLHRVIEMLEMYTKDDVPEEFFEELGKDNGASNIVNYIIDDCTLLNIYVGKAVNEAYADKSLPFHISPRSTILESFVAVTEKMGITVRVHYF